jgi:hypothetical protein
VSGMRARPITLDAIGLVMAARADMPGPAETSPGPGEACFIRQAGTTAKLRRFRAAANGALGVRQDEWERTRPLWSVIPNGLSPFRRHAVFEARRRAMHAGETRIVP